MPKDIQPSETVAMLYYIKAQHSDLVFYLSKRMSSSLGQLFVDAREIEENLWACDRLRDQEQEEEYERQRSDLGLHSFQYCDPSFSDFNFPPDLKTTESDSSTIQDLGNLYQQGDSPCSIEKISSYMQKDDYALNFLGDFQEVDFAEGNDQFVEEEVVIPKRLAAHIIDQKSLFSYDDKIDKECQKFPGHLFAPNCYDVFSIYEMSLAEKEDNSVVKVADLTQKQFDQ